MKRLFLFLSSVFIIAFCVLPAQAQAQGPTGQNIGDVKIFAGDAYTAPPYGYLLCNGATVSRTGVYADLFAVIGTKYGAGNGSTTFKLPDTSSIFVLGASGETPGSTSCGNQTCALQRGATGGVYAHQLTVGELATHQHELDYIRVNAAAGSGTAVGYPYGSGTHWGVGVGNTGSGQAHNNMPPYVAMYYIIAYTTSITNAAPTATPTTQPTYTPAATHTPPPNPPPPADLHPGANLHPPADLYARKLHHCLWRHADGDNSSG